MKNTKIKNRVVYGRYVIAPYTQENEGEKMKVKDSAEIDVLKWLHIVEEEINLKSDRAMVVTSASILDTQLEMLLRKFMIKDNKIEERLFNNAGALATFSAKNSMCYYLGLISKYEFENIEIIRKIRNRFAHEIEIKKMNDDQSIIDFCNNFTLPKELYIPEIVHMKDGKILELIKEPIENIDIQTRFMRVFKNITMYLDYRNIEISEIKRNEYKNMKCIELLKDGKNKLLELNKKRYELNVEYKQRLLSKIKKEDNKEKIREMEAKIEIIDKEITAYKEGDLFYGTTVKPDEGGKAYINSYDEMIELFEKNIEE